MSMIDTIRRDFDEFKEHREIRNKLKSDDFDLM